MNDSSCLCKKSGDDHYALMLKEKRGTDFKLFTEALQKVVDKKLKADDGWPVDEKLDYLSGVQALLSAVARRVFIHSPLLDKDKTGRWNWEKLTLGLRQIVRRRRDNLTMKLLAPQARLEDGFDRLFSLLEQMSQATINAEAFLQQHAKYLDNLAKGALLAERFNGRNQHLEEQYTLYKTWSTDEEWEIFNKLLDGVVDSSLKIFIEGPFQLVAMISKDEFFVIFKLLTLDSVFDLLNKDAKRKDFEEIADLVLYVKESLLNSKTIKLARELTIDTLKQMVEDWRKEAVAYRSQLPSRELRQSFVKRYEDGILFKK